MLLPLALLLGGCVSQPAPMSPKVTVGGSVGGVSLQARQAQLRRGIVPTHRAFLGGRRGGPGERLAAGGGGRR